MANKRKRETDNVVPECLSKATDSTFQSFEATVTQIQAKKSKIVDTVARKVKETRRHCEAFTGEKMIVMEKCMSQSDSIESALLGITKSASNFSAKVSQMEKKLKDFSKFISQVDLDTRNELQNFDPKP